MPRQAGIKTINKFQKGLITEATGLNFPEDAVTETLNVIYEPEGIARRRKGFQREISGSPVARSANQGSAFVEYLWKNAAGNAEYNFVVIYHDGVLSFFRTSGDSLSANQESGTIDLTLYKTRGSDKDVIETACTFASGNNYLFVAHPLCNPIYVEYSDKERRNDPTFFAYEIELKVRDFEGVEDGYEIDERPKTLTKYHKYNLFNQGWYKDVQRDDEGSRQLVDPIDHWHDTRDEYPSNADIWWVYKESQGFFRPNVTGDSIALGNTRAPRGHYILNAFNLDRSGATGIRGLDTETSRGKRPSIIAFFTGRVWYAGVADTKFAANIYFSQIVEDESYFGLCYQANDPTSEQAADLLPSDGGVVRIPEIGTIYKLVPIQSSLLIFASNGVWSISGSEGLGFRANDYSVRKISNVGAINATSFVDVEGFAMWWNQDGIYGVTTDNVGSFQVQSITDNTIKTYFESIPSFGKLWAKAAYNSQTKTITWVYRTNSEVYNYQFNRRYYYDSILVYNLISQGFYVHQVDQTDKVIIGVIAYEGRGSITVEEAVTDNDDVTVTDTLTDDVVVNVNTLSDLSSVTKFPFLNTGGETYSFAEERNTDYLDWDEVEYDSYFVSGYNLEGQAANFTQSNYVLVHCNEVAGTGVYVEGIFDWATSASTGKWSTRQQAYNNNLTNRSVRVSKLKVRGKGRSIQLRFSNDAEKPFEVIGWSMLISGNQTV